MRYTLFLAFFLTFIACQSEPATTAVQQADTAIPVRTAKVERRSTSLPVVASGILTSAHEQRLAFKIGGVIRKIYVDEGDVVRAGQLLAILDKTEIDAQVSQAQQALTKAERDYERVKGLYSDSSATLELLQNAGTGRDVARETARIAAFNQQYAEIRAGANGRVIKKLANEGEIIGPGMPAFVLFETGPDDWVARIQVSDRDWARIQKGMPAELRIDAFPDTQFRGKVTDLSPSADPSNGLYQVEINVPQQGKRFAPGLFVQARIQTPPTPTLAVAPIEAIVEGEGRQAFVYVPQGDQVKKQAVTIYSFDNRFVWISRGLENIDEVVVEGTPYLTESKKIRKMN